eukprot:4734731-Prymnesium_polylepis.2
MAPLFAQMNELRAELQSQGAGLQALRTEMQHGMRAITSALERSVPAKADAVDANGPSSTSPNTTIAPALATLQGVTQNTPPLEGLSALATATGKLPGSLAEGAEAAARLLRLPKMERSHCPASDVLDAAVTELANSAVAELAAERKRQADHCQTYGPNCAARGGRAGPPSSARVRFGSQWADFEEEQVDDAITRGPRL